MAASSSQGINTLLEAEREAAKIVQKAKQYRIQRLKDARSEAAKEIEDLKAQKNLEYQNFVAQHSGASDASLGVVDQETDAKIAEIQSAFAANKETASDKILEAVKRVEAKPHINVRV
ncbi:G subunit of V-type ATPase [Phascolomyces articulosus]|uniref:V-type proton ATPase subunit G n=1 Tax=Phascolomyces articulosus TaxID=60185 RepID=A0AAD5K9V6_9FUNG|nr:G subunit of V-type ATPase [Phascolomyces articulosus]